MKDKALGHINKGEFETAEKLLLACLEQQPGDAHAWFLLGASCAQLGKFPDCIAHCKKALALNPDYLDAWYNLAQACMAVSNTPAAISAYRNVLRLAPDNLTVLNNLGVALQRIGKIDEAIETHKRAATVDPAAHVSHLHLAQALLVAGKGKEAENCLVDALKTNPGNIDIRRELGALYLRRGKSTQAIEHLGVIVQKGHKDVDIIADLALAHLARGEFSKTNSLLREALAIEPLNNRVQSAYLFSLNYDNEDADFIYHEHVRLMSSRPCAGRKRTSNQTDGRINIGYISPDLKNHSVAHFLKPLLRTHARQNFRIHCYASLKREDKVSREIKSMVDKWVRIDELSAEQAAAAIRADNIDILVDLAGHTVYEIMPIMCQRPAAIQLTYLGYPNTSGSKAIDYRITDELSDPAGSADALYTETLLRLPHGFLCYEPPADAPAIAAQHDRGTRPVTFGSFNNYIKITDAVIHAWAQILERAPGSQLILKTRYLGDRETSDRLLRRFAERGIVPERLRLMDRLPGRDAHLAAYNNIDIALDTFPYNGTTTTCEALWMGTPVVALRGTRHAGRVSSSILTHAGLEELVAATVDDYVSLAVELAQHPERIRHYKTHLREQLSASPMLDEAGFTKTLEKSFIKLLNTSG